MEGSDRAFYTLNIPIKHTIDQPQMCEQNKYICIHLPFPSHHQQVPTCTCLQLLVSPLLPFSFPAKFTDKISLTICPIFVSCIKNLCFHP